MCGEEKKQVRGKKSASVERGTPREGAGWRERGRERLEVRSRDRESSYESIASGNERNEGPVRRVRGLKGGGGEGRGHRGGYPASERGPVGRGRARERDAGVGTHLPIHMYVSTRRVLRCPPLHPPATLLPLTPDL